MTRRDMWLASLGIVIASDCERAAAQQYAAPERESKEVPAVRERREKSGVDIKTLRYEDLTAAELVSMVVGQPLLATEPDQAERVMQLSLDLEHFIAVIPLDPDEVDPEDRREIRKLRDQLTALTGRKVLLHLFGERGAKRGNDVEPARKPKGS